MSGDGGGAGQGRGVGLRLEYMGLGRGLELRLWEAGWWVCEWGGHLWFGAGGCDVHPLNPLNVWRTMP